VSVLPVLKEALVADVFDVDTVPGDPHGPELGFHGAIAPHVRVDPRKACPQ